MRAYASTTKSRAARNKGYRPVRALICVLSLCAARVAPAGVELVRHLIVLEPAGHCNDIAVWASMPATRYRVERVVRPIDFSRSLPIH